MKQRLYPRPVPIGPNRHPADQIKDAEAFARYYLDAEFEKIGMYLEHDEYTETLSLLITHLWRLSERFDPERNDCFANYARSILPNRAYDVGPRRILGRNGIKLPERHHEQLDESTLNRRHDPPLPDQQSNQDPDRGPDAQRLQTERDRERAWALHILGCRPARTAA